MFSKFTLSANLLAGLISSWFANSNLEVTRIDLKNPAGHIIEELQQFEASFVYPFSDTQTFTIQHGKNGDYFSFFKGLGKPYYYVVKNTKHKVVLKEINGKKIQLEQNAGEIAAAACAILCPCKTTDGKEIKAWYICDLKVNEKYQGEHIPMHLAYNAVLGRFVQCPRGYAICMNPVSGDPKAARIFKKQGPVSGMTNSQTLNFYTMNMEEVQDHYDYLKRGMVRFGYMQRNHELGVQTTNGSKNYNIKNLDSLTSHTWNLNHLVPSSNGFIPQADATYMICAVKGSRLDTYIQKELGRPSSTAQIISYGMKNVDFNFLTSNQI